MIGPLLSAAIRTLGATGAAAGRFVNSSLAGHPKRFGAMYYGSPYENNEDQTAPLKWLAGAAKEAGAGLLFVGRLGVAGAAATKGLELFANKLMQRSEDLQLFHGGIAAAFSRMEFQQLGLQLRRAQATAPGAMRFADAVMQMREDTLQGRILMDNLWNTVGTGMAKIVSFIASTAEPVFKMISDKLVAWGAIAPPDASRNRIQGDMLEHFNKMNAGQFGHPISQRPGRDGRL